jgi:hypothetical protein
MPTRSRSTPPAPAAHTRPTDPVTAYRCCETPLSETLHARPSKCTMVPAFPTAQTSVALFAHAALRYCAAGTSVRIVHSTPL